tara:strand:+ start:480 stop:1256 length:777 start_codon:yes stop_codon:yes gene_type:complete
MKNVNDIPIYLTTSNGREHIIKVFCHLFNKYWGEDKEVNVVGYDKPNFEMPSNFKFISMGKQVGGPAMWATDLRKFFETKNDPYFIHVLDDQFISSPTRFDIMQDVFNYMITNNAVNANLGNIREHNGLIRFGDFQVNERNDEYDICTLSQNAEYRISTAFSIWEREYHLKYMILGRNPWEYEVLGSVEAKNDGTLHICTDREYPVYRIEGVVADSINTFNWKGNETSEEAGYTPVSENDVLEMIDLGIIYDKNNVSL